MNEIDKIQTQIAALLQARDFLLHQTPSDMVAIADITERMVALTRRQGVLTRQATPLPSLTPDQERALRAAVDSLEGQIRASRTASDIMAAVTTLLNAG
jgi:hypothetical protein